MGSRIEREGRDRRIATILFVGILAAGFLSLHLGTTTGALAATGTSELSLTKADSPDPVNAGAPLAYSIAVSNAGPDAAADVVVTDNLPKGVSFVSAESTQGTCSVSGNGRKVTCALGTLAVNFGPQYIPAPVAITIRVLAPTKVGRSGTISNKASVDSDAKDPKGGNNSDTESTRVVEAPTISCDGHTATLVGTGGPDLLMGTAGNDVIFAGAGEDRVFSFGGDDLICAGAGGDLVGGGARSDTVFAGRGPDRLFGGGGSDVLGGAPGADLLRGGRGPDLLAGGLGRDRCFGGAGRDLFRSC